MKRCRIAIIVVVVLHLTSTATLAQRGTETPSAPAQTLKSQKYEHEGVTVEFATAGNLESGRTWLMEGSDATIRFRVNHTSSGQPLDSLRPAAWVDRLDAGATSTKGACREKVQSFLQGSLSRRPTLDLNSYFILALNDEPNISVIDPLAGFGGNKLLTLIVLPSPGEDWVMGPDKRLYVSMPRVNQVAVVDTSTYKVIARVDAGTAPSRLFLQKGGKHLWVGNDAPLASESGVTVIDTTTLKVLARLRTGLGHHEILVTPNDRSAFVTNRDSGTVSVIDVRNLASVKEIKVGALPISLAFSALRQAVYVASEGEGTVSVIGGTQFETLARMPTAPGLRSIRISPDGRYGVGVNQPLNLAYVFDLSTNRLAHTIPVGPKSDQITFTQQFAYVRATGNEFVTMINLAALGTDATVSRFPGGQKAPQESGTASLADAIVPAPESGAVLVANPADKMIYYYTEGMVAPMGSFQNYRRAPRAVLVIDRSLREVEPGVYATDLRLPSAGVYDVAFLLDAPRLVNCFKLEIAKDPALPREGTGPIKVALLPSESAMQVGKDYKLRFKVTDPATKSPRLALSDMGVLVFLAPGIWQKREWAKHVGDGVYEMNFVPPEPGIYHIHFQSPSLGVKFSQIMPVTLTATKDGGGTQD